MYYFKFDLGYPKSNLRHGFVSVGYNVNFAVKLNYDDLIKLNFTRYFICELFYINYIYIYCVYSVSVNILLYTVVPEIIWKILNYNFSKTNNSFIINFFLK